MKKQLILSLLLLISITAIQCSNEKKEDSKTTLASDKSGTTNSNEEVRYNLFIDRESPFVNPADTNKAADHVHYTAIPAIIRAKIDSLNMIVDEARHVIQLTMDSLLAIDRSELKLMNEQQQEDYFRLTGTLLNASNNLGRTYYTIAIEGLQAVSNSLKKQVGKMNGSIKKIKSFNQIITDISNVLGKIVNLIEFINGCGWLPQLIGG